MQSENSEEEQYWWYYIRGLFMGAMLAPGLHLGGVGVPVSLRHNGLSVVRIRGSSYVKLWLSLFLA